MILVSIPRVMKSLRSTSMRACRRGPSGWTGSSSMGCTRQLLKMGKSSPRLISETLILERKSGFCGPLRMLVREVRIASSS